MRHSPPGCIKRFFNTGGREAILMVFVLAWPRTIVGCSPNSSDCSLLRLARVQSSCRSCSWVIDASILPRLFCWLTLLVLKSVISGMIFFSCLTAWLLRYARCVGQLCQYALHEHFQSRTEVAFWHNLHFCITSRSTVWKLKCCTQHVETLGIEVGGCVTVARHSVAGPPSPIMGTVFFDTLLKFVQLCFPASFTVKLQVYW